MSLLNESMAISGLDKNNLTSLKNNLSITNLEIKQLTLKDNWELLSELKQLRSLTVKDSYVDFKKFYSAICSLPKLERLIYNHYCFFNKNKKDKLPDNLKLSSLKIFKLEFPDESEPDFEINTYAQKSYKNKHNSITELKDCHKIFPNLEEIQFVNYQTYRKRMEDEYVDNKKLNSTVYWNMDFKVLKKFNSLKKIKINDGKPFSIISSGLSNIINSKQFQETNISINQIHGLSEMEFVYKDNKVLNIIHDENNKGTNVSSREINPKISKNLKSIIPYQNSISINEEGLFDRRYGYRQAWKIKKNNLIPKIIHNQIETIIFSDAGQFTASPSHGLSKRKKLAVFLKLFCSIKNLRNIVFDFSKFNKKEEEYDQTQFIFFKLFLYELYFQKPDINVYFCNDQVRDLCKNKKNNFEVHLAYLINFLKNNNFFNHQFKFLEIEEKELISFYNNYIDNRIDEIVVIDDYFFNNSKRFFDQDVIYSSEIGELKNHFPHFSRDYYEDKKIKIPLKRNYNEILRIATFDSDFFPLDQNKLLLLVKKRNLNKLKNIKFKKYFSYIGNTWHHITHKMDEDKKILKIDNIYDDGSDKYSIRLNESASTVVDWFIDSNEFEFSTEPKKKFLKPIESIDYVTESGLDKDKLNELTHCWFEGVNPWQGKYIKFKKLNDLIPTENLEALRLSDCLALDNLDIPYFPQLKYLRLDLHINHHKKILDPDFKCILKNFENLPNLRTLEINGLFGKYNSNLVRSAGLSWGDNAPIKDRWGILNTNIKTLKKLEFLTIDTIKASNLNDIISLPALKNLQLKTIHLNEAMGLDDNEDVQKPIQDSDFKFLKKSKLLNVAELRIGETARRDYLNISLSSSYYKGSGEFIDYISHNLKELYLSVNFDIENQLCIQDIINKICNRFLKLEKLTLKFGIAVSKKSFDFENNEYKKRLKDQTIDFKKFSKLQKLTNLHIEYSSDEFIKYNIKNFNEIIKLKKLKYFFNFLDDVPFEDLRKTRKLFSEENYTDQKYYDEEYEYLEEEQKKNWTRFSQIIVDDYDYITFEDRYLEIEKKENEKKYKKPKQIVRKRKN